MILLKERIGKMLEYLQEQVYPKQVAELQDDPHR